jgi:hypothetical protein
MQDLPSSGIISNMITHIELIMCLLLFVTFGELVELTLDIILLGHPLPQQEQLNIQC